MFNPDKDDEIKAPDWSQEIEEYYRRHQRYSLHSAESFKKTLDLRRFSAQDILDRIDTVDKYLVAKLEVAKLYVDAIRKDMIVNPKVWRAIRYALPDSHPDATSPETVDPDEIRRRALKEGLDRDPKINDTISKVLDQLLRSSGLFELISNLPTDSESDIVKAGAFLVAKANSETFRIIINARWNNIRYKSKDDSFALFRVENVIQVISNLRMNDWFAINIDLRHWFHEIPLPGRYRHLFLLYLAFQSGNNNLVLKILAPLMVPMGWIKSPFIGQTLTWALILSCGYGTMNYNKLDLDPQYLEKLTSTPRWLPLKSGGGIFVILDNVCVVTPDKRIRDAWFEHLTANAKKYHAVFKVKDPNPFREPRVLYESNYSEYKDLLRSQTCIDMLLGSDAHFDFTGVTFRPTSRSLAVTAEEKQQTVPPGTCSDYSWSGSRRQLASIIGRVNWYRRVHAINPANEDSTSDNLRYCYSVITPKEGQSWNSVIRIASCYFRSIAATWQQRNLEGKTDACRLETELKAYALMAVDAASRTAQLGYSYFAAGNSIPIHFGEAYSILDYKDIALAELKAIVEGVKYCIKHNMNLNLVVIATDNLNAKVWAERGYGKCAISNSLLRELNYYLDLHKLRLYLVYVESESNSADCPTRHEEMTKEREDASKQILLVGLDEARGVWRLGGGSFCM